jgi:alkyl hydroperoxide reductase subunit AhpC
MINQIAKDHLVSAIMPAEGDEEPQIQDIHLLTSFPNQWIVLVFHPLAFTFVSPVS